MSDVSKCLTVLTRLQYFYVLKGGKEKKNSAATTNLYLIERFSYDLEK